jgi:endonuclease/exonuclease/phosphatase family metal-dependent hydrolase
MLLRVATFNVWGLPEPLSVDPLRRLRAIAARLPGLAADVVAFQEVWYADARRVLVDGGRHAGLVHAWAPSSAIGGSGLLVVSRLPIAEAALAPFALRGLPERVTHGDFYGGKGYVRMRLDAPGGPLTLVATHLHARYAADVRHAYLPYRTGQVVQLALGTAAVEDPLIAAGDFNFTRGSDEHGLLTGLSGLRDLAYEIGRAQPTVLRANPFRAHSTKPDRRVDYVFGRDGRRSRVRAQSVQRIFADRIGGGPLAYSNHAGVLAELAIEPATREAGWTPATSAIETAQRILAAGREEARQRQAEQRKLTSAGLGIAALVAIGDRRLPPVGRRRFLRAGLQVAAAAALAPSLGCSVLSEVFVPEEIRAYDHLSAALASFQPDRRQPGA